MNNARIVNWTYIYYTKLMKGLIEKRIFQRNMNSDVIHERGERKK